MALAGEPEILFEGAADAGSGELASSCDTLAAGPAEEIIACTEDLLETHVAPCYVEERCAAEREGGEPPVVVNRDAESLADPAVAEVREKEGAEENRHKTAATSWEDSSIQKRRGSHVLDNLLAAGGGSGVGGLLYGGAGRSKSDRIEALLQLSLDEAAALQRGEKQVGEQHLGGRKERGVRRRDSLRNRASSSSAVDAGVGGEHSGRGGPERRKGNLLSQLEVQEKLTMSLDDLINREQEEQQLQQVAQQQQQRRRHRRPLQWSEDVEEEFIENEEEEDLEAVRCGAEAEAVGRSSRQRPLQQQRYMFTKRSSGVRGRVVLSDRRQSRRREEEEYEEEEDGDSAAAGKWIPRRRRQAAIYRGPYQITRPILTGASDILRGTPSLLGRSPRNIHRFVAAEGAAGNYEAKRSLPFQRQRETGTWGISSSISSAAGNAVITAETMDPSGIGVYVSPNRWPEVSLYSSKSIINSNGRGPRYSLISRSFPGGKSEVLGSDVWISDGQQQQHLRDRHVRNTADTASAAEGMSINERRDMRTGGEYNDEEDDPTAARWQRAFRRAVLLPLHVGTQGWKYLVDVKPNQQESLAAFIIYSGTGMLHQGDIAAFFKPLSPRFVIQLHPPSFFIVAFPSAAAADAALQQRSESCCHVLTVLHKRLRELQEKMQQEQHKYKEDEEQQQKQEQPGQQHLKERRDISKDSGQKDEKKNSAQEKEQRQQQAEVKDASGQQQANTEDVDMEEGGRSKDRLVQVDSNRGTSIDIETHIDRSVKDVKEAATDDATDQGGMQQKEKEGQRLSSNHADSSNKKDRICSNTSSEVEAKKHEEDAIASAGLPYIEGDEAWTLQQAGSFLDDDDREVFLLQLEKWRRTAPVPFSRDGGGAAARVLIRRATVSELRECASSLASYSPVEAEFLVAAAAPRRVCLSQSSAGVALVEPRFSVSAAVSDTATRAYIPVARLSPAAGAVGVVATVDSPPTVHSSGSAIRKGRVLLAPAAKAAVASASSPPPSVSLTSRRGSSGVWLVDSAWSTTAATLSSKGSLGAADVQGNEAAAKALPSLQLLRQQRQQQQQKYSLPIDFFSAAAAGDVARVALFKTGVPGFSPWSANVGDSLASKGPERTAGVEENELKQDESLLRSCGGDFRTRILQGQPVSVGEVVSGASFGQPPGQLLTSQAKLGMESPEVIEIDSPDEQEDAMEGGATTRKKASANGAALPTTAARGGGGEAGPQLGSGKSVRDVKLHSAPGKDDRGAINGEKGNVEDGQWTEAGARRPHVEVAEEHGVRDRDVRAKKKGYQAEEEKECYRDSEEQHLQHGNRSVVADWKGGRRFVRESAYGGEEKAGGGAAVVAPRVTGLRRGRREAEEELQEDEDAEPAAESTSLHEGRLRRRQPYSYGLEKSHHRQVFERDSHPAASAGTGGTSGAPNVKQRGRLYYRRRSSSGDKRRRRGTGSRSRSSSCRRRSSYGHRGERSGSVDRGRASLDRTGEAARYGDSSGATRSVRRVSRRSAEHERHASTAYEEEVSISRRISGGNSHDTSYSYTSRRSGRAREVGNSKTGSRAGQNAKGRSTHAALSPGRDAGSSAEVRRRQQLRHPRGEGHRGGSSSSERAGVAGSRGAMMVRRERLIKAADEGEGGGDYVRRGSKVNRVSRHDEDGPQYTGGGHTIRGKSNNVGAPTTEERRRKGRGLIYAHSRKSMVADRHSHGSSRRRPSFPP